MILERVIPPGKTIKEQLKLHNWSNYQFALRMHICEQEANKLIRGSTLLTPYVATNLEYVLGISKDFWLKMEKIYRSKSPKIFKDHKFHIAMWEWLAEHPGKRKQNWPGWKENGGRINYRNHVYCFACAPADTVYGKCCDKCPLEWEKRENDTRKYAYCEDNPNSPYAKWATAETLEDKKKYATIIAHLPLANGWTSKV